MERVLTLLLACAHPSAPTATPSEKASASSWRIPVRFLQDVACDGGRCLALHGGQLSRLPTMQPIPGLQLPEWDTLRHGEQGWEVEGPCGEDRCVTSLSLDPPGVGTPSPVPGLPVGAEAPENLGDLWIDGWNLARKQGWRSGFDRVVVAQGPGTVRLLKGMDGAAQLIRQGVDPAVARIGLGGAEGPEFPATLAMHPTGIEAYLSAWPSPLVIAVDPNTLQRHWTLPLEGAAQGLFVDTTGRFLVVGVGTTEVTSGWAWPLPSGSATADPFRDEAIRGTPRPPISTVDVIDLQDHTVKVELRGSYRRWLTLPDGRQLVATDQELVFFTP